ncbi:hypothetical protein [Haloarchaeobius sp. DT45]|uniref:hypothetical protein n=1 Tax=Haloarchaeobius sp. DT45 TaxID=3446116 RepID=UPI003F6D0FB9
MDGRNVPTNIADELDSHRNYISNRLQHLTEQDLTEHIGSKRTGLYEITPAGEQALVTERDHGTSVDIQTRLNI